MDGEFPIVTKDAAGRQVPMFYAITNQTQELATA